MKSCSFFFFLRQLIFSFFFFSFFFWETDEPNSCSVCTKKQNKKKNLVLGSMWGWVSFFLRVMLSRMTSLKNYICMRVCM